VYDWYWLCRFSKAGVCFADLGNDVICVDNNVDKNKFTKKRKDLQFMNLVYQN